MKTKLLLLPTLLLTVTACSGSISGKSDSGKNIITDTGWVTVVKTNDYVSYIEVTGGGNKIQYYARNYGLLEYRFVSYASLVSDCQVKMTDYGTTTISRIDRYYGDNVSLAHYYYWYENVSE